jgi:hypothetical protein
MCALAQDFCQEQDFPESNLFQRVSRTLEKLLSAESREKYSGGVLEPRWSNLLREKPFFSHVVSCDELALREILLLEQSWVKAHMDWRHF